ncbi:MAG: Asp-tRNA(Asn)/Glu-tRNA(Gln) amidotransferase subunit GatA [Chloroflexi bacterium]|nr:Asp-tRNA(Asn)/Glu-tRNA(Gln) amidotransferase subunit GatA [Chloroflexota bacterium]MCL5075080.1 Asp-tRNA(Asn)/Glu-tRNA(Gln) amidotransferase subunit GatA [Chloroflexota bacterium]
MDLSKLTIHEAYDLLCRRQTSSRELTRFFLERIEHENARLGAYLTLTPEVALEQATQADALIAQGDGGPLSGVPGAIKDNICAAGVRTTCASRILSNFTPPYDANVIERLKAAGMVMLGKTNMDEFAMGSSTENSAFFPTRNPWDTERVPGGSSGGSAAAVTAGLAVYALGSDTGGSVRLPASFCGLVGLKPTYGRVSRYGLVAFASSFDQIGPLTKDVTDCALLMNIIAGYDRRDSTSLNAPVPDYTADLVPEIKGLRIGIPKEYFVSGMQPAVEKVMRQALATLADLGAEMEETSLPHTEYATAAYYIIAPSEASANLARYDGVKYGFSAPGEDMWDAYTKTRQYGFGPEVKRRIMLGTYALSAGYYEAYYLKAQKVRTLIKSDFDKAFERFDLLVTPTSPTAAFKIGERIDDPLAMYLSDVFTTTANLAGIPALNVPCGFVDGLPVGMQLLGKPLAEGTLLRVGYAFEQSRKGARK